LQRQAFIPKSFKMSSFSSIRILRVLYFAITACAQAIVESSPKRGLVFTPDPAHPNDDMIWVQANSDLNWYYNYGRRPSPQFATIPQSKLEFVPMFWGPDTGFFTAVTELIKGGGNITHVLGFNEPDNAGQSNASPSLAAQAWEREITPLQMRGIKAGAPVVQGPSGMAWLKEFSAACQNCTFDFIPLHFFDNQYGLDWYVATLFHGE
jgi:Glycosyl hydrolase catalytic core